MSQGFLSVEIRLYETNVSLCRRNVSNVHCIQYRIFSVQCPKTDANRKSPKAKNIPRGRSLFASSAPFCTESAGYAHRAALVSREAAACSARSVCTKQRTPVSRVKHNLQSQVPLAKLLLTTYNNDHNHACEYSKINGL